MSQQKTKVMFIGAAGNIGSHITKHLLSTKLFMISALTRTSSSSTFPPDVTRVTTDYTLESLTAAFQGQDIVICTISTSSLGQQMTIAHAAVAAGVKRFIPTELGINTSSDKVLEVATCMFLKRDVMKYLHEHENAMSWTAIFCGLWLDFSLTASDFTWWSLQDRRMTIFDNGNIRFEATTLEQTARAIVASILPEHIEATKNQFVYVRSAAVTPNELLGYLLKHTGTIEGDWTVDHVRIGELAAKGRKAFGEVISSGQPPEVLEKNPKFYGAIVDMVSACLMGDYGFNQFGDKTGPWMERFNLVEEDAEGIVRDEVQRYMAVVKATA